MIELLAWPQPLAPPDGMARGPLGAEGNPPPPWLKHSQGSLQGPFWELGLAGAQAGLTGKLESGVQGPEEEVRLWSGGREGVGGYRPAPLRC